MPSEDKDLTVGLKTIQKKCIYYHLALKWIDFLETSYLCSNSVFRHCNSVVPVDWKDPRPYCKDVRSWHCQQDTLWLYFILCEPLCTSEIILGGVVFGLFVFWGVVVIAELKVKLVSKALQICPPRRKDQRKIPSRR